MISKLYVLITDNTDPYHNLALEKYLFDHPEPDSCLLYLWQNENTVVIGYNQNPYNECDLDAMGKDQVRLVRRLSGGGAVYHDLGNLNFTFICPRRDFDEQKQSAIILDALNSLGIKAEKSGRNDLLAEGRKFSGHAYYHHGNTSYHHGTLMVEVDSEKMSRYLNVSLLKLNDKHVRSVKSRVVNLRELKPDLQMSDLRQALITAFSNSYGLKVSFLRESDLDEKEISRLTGFFSNEQFIYGENRHLPSVREKRFSWGLVRIEYELEDDILKDVIVYSDSLHSDYLASLPALLKGKETNQLKAVLNDPEYREVNRDIISLLNEKE